MQQILFKPFTNSPTKIFKNNNIDNSSTPLNYLKKDEFKKSNAIILPKDTINFTSSNIKLKQNLSFKEINDQELEITKIGKNGIIKAKMPKYLYHLTSRESFNKILKSRTILPSKREQLKGVYLLDKDNFIDFYPNTEIDGKSHDLMGSLLLQARANRNGVFEPSDGRYVLIKLPTKELLEKGDIRIRKQEEYFNFSKKLEKLRNELEEYDKYYINEMDKEDLGTLKKEIKEKNLMDDKETEQFFKDFKKQIKKGYSIFEASEGDFKNKGSIEYAFKSPINLDELQEKNVIYFDEYELFTCFTYDFEKIRRIFSGVFDEAYC